MNLNAAEGNKSFGHSQRASDRSGQNEPTCYDNPSVMVEPASSKCEMHLDGRRVTIMGLGRHGGGVAAARYCVSSGAVVRVTDLAHEHALAESLAELNDLPIARLTLGHHDAEDFRAAEIVVVNPAVRTGNEFVEVARREGVKLISEIGLFMCIGQAYVSG